ncbi:Mur ligase [Halobellus rufus]|uniref:Mur ligase n=1 Tax=Halobellus rufus TaxID=1448860 RepID=UPI0009DE02BF|nr:Mur ligase [Halobellus rufus]
MIEQGYFEVRPTEGGWGWWLHDGEVDLAVSPERYADAKAARRAIDAVRDATAEIECVSDFEFAADHSAEERPQLRIRGEADLHVFEWRLQREGSVLAMPGYTYPSRESVAEAAERFRELATGSVPVYLTADAETPPEPDPFYVGKGRLRDRLRSLLTLGRRHRRFLDSIDTRIVVSGIRGKSSTVRRLDDVFNRRGYDVLTKMTGNHPTLVRNGEVIPIDRPGPYTTLYENINVLREFAPALDSYTPEDVAIFENQGITEYTTRLFNERFVEPHVVVLANVRQDHQDTLGKTRREIARAFARTIPPDTTVVSGELHPLLHEYMAAEIEQAGATLTQVQIPPTQRDRIGAETVYAVNEVLRALDMDPVPEAQLNEYLDAIQPEWTQVPNGRVFNGAEINDIESTEAIRRALAGEERILPFVYLRADRRSRTASFATYLNTLADRGLIERARAGGAFTDVFAANVDVPVTTHDREEDAGDVLEEMLAADLPVMLMGNTVDDFMRDIETEIAVRAQEAAIEDTPEALSPARPEP